MLLEELIKTERKEGKVEERIETIKELLEEVGTLPEALKEQLEGETDLNTLRVWTKIAAKAESIEQFVEKSQINRKSRIY